MSIQTRCLNPQIILNPDFERIVGNYSNISTGTVTSKLLVCVGDPDHLLTYYDLVRLRKTLLDERRQLTWFLSPKRYSVTPDTLDRYWFVDADECWYPLYVAVPCGKCVICRDRRSKDWVCRCCCEDEYSSNGTYFVTLTYAQDPESGLQKRDVQLFFKRIRRYFYRNYIECNLRYFCVGEYGKHGHPHYHLLLWNMPIGRRDDGTPLDTTNLARFVYDAIKANWSYGFIKCERCDSGAAKYVAKYLRKDCDVPAGCNPTFLLVSRKPFGLGYQKIDDMRALVQKHPDTMSVTVLDKLRGKVNKFAMPIYFKSKLYPSLSSFLPADVYRDLRTYMTLRRRYHILLCKMPDLVCNLSNPARVPYFDRLCALFGVSLTGDDAPFREFVSRAYQFTTIHDAHTEEFMFNVKWLIGQLNYLYDIYHNLNLTDAVDVLGDIDAICIIKSKYKSALLTYMSSLPDTDLIGLAARINHDIDLHEQKLSVCPF